MTPSRNIFAAPILLLDGSETAERAMPVTAALARQAGTAPTLVMAVSHTDHESRGREILERAASELGNLEARTELLVGAPAVAELLGYLATEGTVVVMSTHAHSALGELLLGSVAEELVRRVSQPVVLVGPQVDVPAAAAGYHELVTCVDSHDAAARLAPVVRSCSVDLGMKPWLFHVVSPDAHPDADVSESAVVQHAAEGLTREGVALDWDIGHDHDPARSIIAFAQTHAAPIIALATQGSDPAERLREASTTVTVARHATCPVLVVGPSCHLAG